MDSRALVILAVVATLAVSISAAAAGEAGGDCSSKFKKDDKHANVSTECIKNLKIDPEEMPKSEEEFAKNFDDKCFGKCFMTAMGFIKDSKFDRDLIEKDIKEHIIDEPLRKKVTEYTIKCMDEAEASTKAEGGKITEKNECKVSAHFLYCSMKEEEKLEC